MTNGINVTHTHLQVNGIAVFHVRFLYNFPWTLWLQLLLSIYLHLIICEHTKASFTNTVTVIAISHGNAKVHSDHPIDVEL